MAFSIGPIKESDFAEWSEVWRKYLEFYKTTLPEAQYKDTFSRIVDPKGNIHGIVARDDNKIVGLSHYLFHSNCWTNKPICYLNDLYVNEDCRGKGYGRKLILETQEISKKEGCKKIYWTTAYDNKTAQALYDKVAITDRINYKIDN